MPEKRYWPTEEEQHLCHQLLVTYGDQGYGLCFLFGAYRAQGLSCEEVMSRIRQEMVGSPREGQHG
jgi:hypothetical protein